jgi:hypothetical protein
VNNPLPAPGKVDFLIYNCFSSNAISWFVCVAKKICAQDAKKYLAEEINSEVITGILSH